MTMTIDDDDDDFCALGGGAVANLIAKFNNA